MPGGEAALLRIISGVKPSAAVQPQLRKTPWSDAHDGLIARLEETLTCQRYSRVVVHNYCRNARDFLSYLNERSIALEAVTPTQVSQYLRCAVRHFRERRGRPPASSWTSIP